MRLRGCSTISITVTVNSRWSSSARRCLRSSVPGPTWLAAAVLLRLRCLSRSSPSLSSPSLRSSAAVCRLSLPFLGSPFQVLLTSRGAHLSHASNAKAHEADNSAQCSQK